MLGLALLLLILPGGVYLCALGMFLIGLGNGPLFPNFNYLTPENFGSDISQSVIGIQMASAYIGIMVAPAVCGLLGQVFGMVIFPFYLIVFYAIMIPVTIRIKTVLKRNAK